MTGGSRARGYIRYSRPRNGQTCVGSLIRARRYIGAGDAEVPRWRVSAWPEGRPVAVTPRVRVVMREGGPMAQRLDTGLERQLRNLRDDRGEVTTRSNGKVNRIDRVEPAGVWVSTDASDANRSGPQLVP